jgi:hypothetical protein
VCYFVSVVDDKQPKDVVMGDPSEREYDASLIFKHLCVFASILFRDSIHLFVGAFTSIHQRMRARTG